MSTRNPWKTLKSRVAYKNDWITVREDDVIRPDGKPGIYGVVETRLATGVVAMTPEREIYLVGQYRYAMEEYSWEIVEGGTDHAGESPLEAAQRELREEAGLVAEHWEPLGHEMHLSNCHSNERAYFFLATVLKQVKSCPDGTEQLQVKRVPLAEALRMVDKGEIKDAMSVLALFFLERHPAFA
ncbi:MAG: NUDIX hydrolase [Candidatus Hydrogenedentes bacterium]|nr:NUDIX hydrolase [Candidatus Hydrogenedentota bacterium]MBI3117317.1 NUDIX hydrolase [Candidatus Hydrogenedentota bacterium]